MPKRWRSLALQLAILTCIVGAAADPQRAPEEGAPRARRSVVIAIDVSASMLADDETLPAGARVTRLERARYEAAAVIASLTPEDRGLILILDAQPRPLSGFESDARALARQLDGASLAAATEAPLDLGRGLRVAADLLVGQPGPTLVLIGDGAWPQAVLDGVRRDPGAEPAAPSNPSDPSVPSAPSRIDLGGVDVRYAPVGQTGDNVGIVAFSARRPPSGGAELGVLVAVQRFGGAPGAAKRTVRLELRDGDDVVETALLGLAPGERIERRFDDLAGKGTRMEARILPESGAAGDRLDAFAVDDQAIAVVPPARRQRLLVVTNGNLFLEGALLSDENVEVVRLPPERYEASSGRAFDGVIFDGFTPPAPPNRPALYLDPRGAASPFSIAGELRAPIVTEVATRHPLMRFVSLFDLNLGRASRFMLAPGDVALASVVRDPIYVARAAPHRMAALGFDLKRSDLPLRVAFPVMLQNLLRWFAGDDAAAPASASTAEPVRLAWPEGAEPGALVTLRAPGGAATEIEVVDGQVRFSAPRVGVYEVADEHVTRAVAVNLASAEESAIAPRRALSLDGKELRPPDPAAPRRFPLWEGLALAAILLLLVELWTWHRRITE